MSSQIQIIAHRGASRYAPENSRASFDLAIAMGAQVIECDIAFSQDLVPCIFHDDRLERTSNGHGFINQSNWDELKQLDIGSWFSAKFKGESILSLAELMQWQDNHSHLVLNLEIKTLAIENIVSHVSQILQIVGSRPKIIFSSFQPEILDYLHTIQEPHDRAFLSTRWSSKKLTRASQMGCKQINIANYGVTSTMIEFTHMQGLKIGVYTVNSAHRIIELKQLGVDAVFTDDLKLFSEKE